MALSFKVSPSSTTSGASGNSAIVFILKSKFVSINLISFTLSLLRVAKTNVSPNLSIISCPFRKRQLDQQCPQLQHQLAPLQQDTESLLPWQLHNKPIRPAPLRQYQLRLKAN